MLYIKTLFSHLFVYQEQIGDVFCQILLRKFNKLLFQINSSVFLQRKTKKTKKGVERGQPLILNIGPQNIFRYIG